jgi:diguanylate cyclase
LPGASEENAREVGERIRAGVAGVYFAPGQFAETGDKGMLAVNVAGVMFEDAPELQELYRVAGQHLTGSGGIRIARMPSDLPTDPKHRTAH